MLALCALTLLVGCGGGGGGGSGGSVFIPRTTVDPVPFPDYQPADYATSKSAFEVADEYEVPYMTSLGTSGVDNHLGLIKAAAAYARGATGAGETVVVVDSGIDASHSELNGKVTIVTGIGNSCSPADAAAGRCANARHGTAVASLVAGHRSGSSSGTDIQGVAFDANIKFIPINLRGDNPNLPPALELNAYRWPADRSILDDSADYRQYIAQGEILNYSFGIPWSLAEWRRLGSGCDSTGGETGSYACFKYYYRATANALAQASTDSADRSIVVIAAGNSNGRRHDLNSNRDGQGPLRDATSPDADAAFAVAFNAPGDPDLSHVIAVVAVGSDGRIASYSNRCGLAKSFCIAAPGGDLRSGGSGIVVAAVGGGYGVGQGTSFAAPLVSGSLAVLRQYFRGQLGNTELVTRLLATANRNGRYANSNTYGHGLVDLDAATAPVGMMMTGLSSDSNRRPLADIGIDLAGDAFGTALQAQLAEVEFAAFDELDAPFFLSAENWLTQAARDDGFKREQHDITLTPTSSFDGDRRGTTLSLGFDHDDIQDARLSLADGWWLSYGDQAGRALGLYAHAPLRLGGSGKAMMNHFSDSLAFAAPYLSLVRDGPAVGWKRGGGGGRFGFALVQGTPLFEGYQKPGGERGLGAVLDMRLSRGLWLQAGAVREQESFLGARLQGALGAAQGTTNFFGINGVWAVGDDVNVGGDDLRNHKPWRVLASAYLGRTRAQVNGGLVQEVGTLISSAFSIGAVRESLWRRDDWFGLRLSQPLRTERGHLKMRLPTGRTRYGETVSDDHTMNLAPAGRHVQVEAVYHVPLAGGALQATLGAERHSQHDRSSDIHPTFRVKFERRF